MRRLLSETPAVLAPGQRADAHAWAKASSPGTYRLAVLATTSANQPGAEFEVDVGDSKPESSDFLLIVAAVCGATAFLILLGRKLIVSRSETG